MTIPNGIGAFTKMTYTLAMKTILKTLVPVWIVGFLAACSGISVSQDYVQTADFSALKTYRWDAALEQKEKDLNGDPLLSSRIHSAIDRVLAARGYQPGTDKKADFTVTYHTEVRQRLTSEGTSGSVSVGFGSYANFGAIGIGTGTTLRDEDEATLYIDILSGQDNSLIWRGSSTRYVYVHNDPGELTITINEHVEAILAQFPPKTK